MSVDVVKLLQQILVLLLRLYQRLLSPVLVGLFGPMGHGCRYSPSCSQYAVEAVQRHGAGRGLWFALRRLGRCHPWGGCGDDPVPPRQLVSLPPPAGGSARSAFLPRAPH
ncbi:MAG TPA: membrane protein insertion efficiency factor YidD [Candidatus Dormibacteraeota bacterium]|nr:membrane protein insertion efficiency factor YidD [Verrucomicrobiae bacterium]HXJ72615.1 membrane protein insertion efficiency factor YidD [Candidatus Dormibacteraeota bacterium]